MKSDVILYLQTFVTFVEQDGVLGAAKQLKLSPSTVSAHLSALEGASEVTLFRMNGTKKELTEAGLLLYQGAKGGLREMLNSFELLSKSKAQKRMRVACRSELAPYMATILSSASDLSVVCTTSKDALALLQSGKVDVALTSVRPERAHILFKRVRLSAACYVTSEKSPTAHFNSVLDLPLKTIRCRSFLAYNEALPLLSTFLQKLNVPKAEVRLPLFCEDWYVILQLVRQGIGDSIVPKELAHNETGLKIMDLPDEWIRPQAFYVACHKDTGSILKKFR